MAGHGWAVAQGPERRCGEMEETTAGDILISKHPTEAIRFAIRFSQMDVTKLLYS